MLTLSPSSSTPRLEPAPLTFRTQPTQADIDAVERLVRATGVFSLAEIGIARELVEENLAKGTEASGYYFLFVDGPKGLEGYTCFGPIPGTHARFELYWIAVHPEAQHTRLGRRLQIASEEAARALGAVLMIAETSTRHDYAPARAFYMRQGYQLLADIPDWHDEGDGLAIFGKRL